MSRYSLILLCLLLSIITMKAAVVSPDEAKQIALEFLGHPSQAFGQHSPDNRSLYLKATRQKNHSNEAAFYIYEAEDGGFVMVSADDRLRPVLGFVPQGFFDEVEMPENFVIWMDYLTEQISKMPEQTFARVHKANSYTPVKPLLDEKNIHWGQDEPFSNQCPLYNGRQCPTGCVATAAGQIMRYWEYPTKGQGSHSYEWKLKGETRSADFSKHTYSWEDMPGVYYPSYTKTQADAVSLLMADLGVAFDMQYHPDGSSSSDIIAAHAMVEYFKYDSAIQIIRMDDIGIQTFESKVAKELEQGRPVMLSGRTESDSGHEFICDGVNKDDLFHINWGWDGNFDGDFALTAMYPDGQGTGGALDGKGYTHSVTALIGIQPSKGKAPIHQITVDEISIAEKKASFARNEFFTIQLNMLANKGLFLWEAYVGALICDKDNNIISEYSIYSAEKASLNFTYYYKTVPLYSSAVNNDVTPGDYRLIIAYTYSLTNKNWNAIHFPNGKIAELAIKVKNNEIVFPELLAEDQKADAYIGEMTAKNMGDETMRFSWEAPTLADKYIVNTFSGTEDNLFSSDTITGRRIEVPFYYPGKWQYSWSVQAMNASGAIIAKRTGDDFVMEVTTDYSPKNLSYEVTNNGINFTWAGKAPYYQIEVYHDGELLLRQFPNKKQYFMQYKRDGKYSWNIRSLNQTAKIYISDAVSASFSLPANQGIENAMDEKKSEKYIQNGQFYIRKNETVYDALGR